MTDLGQLESVELLEYSPRQIVPTTAPAGSGEVNRPNWLSIRRLWMLGFLGVTAWLVWQTWWVRRPVINERGWPQVSRFARASVAPRVDGEFLQVVARAALTSIEFAVLGTAVAMLIGVTGGLLTCRAWGPLPGEKAGRAGRVATGLVRTLLAVPRGIHEAVWALGLVFVLGRNPLVAILAIGIPFGAITAKVIADALDGADQRGQQSLRRAGAGRFVSILYGLAPRVAGDVTAYGFYRVECALRASVVLGAIGVGGLGFELALSFQSLRYNEMWTLIYALVALSFIVDGIGTRYRRRLFAGGSKRLTRTVAFGTGLGIVVAAWHLQVRPLSVVSQRTRSLATRLAGEAWPPRLPMGGWSELSREFVATVQLSVIAIGIASLVGVPLAFVAARSVGESASNRWRARTVRGAALVVRSVPPTVWALIVLFVVFPGPLAGGIALGIYGAGVLIRLNADVIEQTDRAGMTALRHGGATRITAFAYGTVPTVGPRLLSMSTYRWGVAARETVIVGLVGAGGLGRTLAQQNAAQDEAGMLTTVAALIIVSVLIDYIGRHLRAAFS